MSKIKYNISMKEFRKRALQDVAIKFYESYKKRMRNVETTREEDIETAFFFGYCTFVKESIVIIDKFIKMNRDTAIDKPNVKDIIDAVLVNLEGLRLHIAEHDLIDTNEQNKELN